MSGLQRIQAFLLASPHDDQRNAGGLSFENTDHGLETSNSEELQDLTSGRSAGAIVVDKICVRPATDAPVALQGISLRGSKGSLTMVISVVGSGKSTLLKALAGELAFESGCIQVFSKRRLTMPKHHGYKMRLFVKLFADPRKVTKSENGIERLFTHVRLMRIYCSCQIRMSHH